MATLRSRTIRLAATFPPESAERAALLSVLAHSKVAFSDADVAQWVIDSYPDRGDARFVVKGMPFVGESVAAAFLESLRSYFASRPFVSDIMQVLQNIDDPGSAITVENQEKAYELFKKDPREFFHEMYHLHGNGKQKFGGNHSYKAIEAWVLRKLGLSQADVNRRLSLNVPHDVSSPAYELLNQIAELTSVDEAIQKFPIVQRLAGGQKLGDAGDVREMQRDLKVEVEIAGVRTKDQAVGRLGGKLLRAFQVWVDSLALY